MKVRLGTWLAGAAAVGTVGLAVFDPWGIGQTRAGADRISTVSQRVFPTLGDRDPNRATIEFSGREGPTVRLVPSGEGHQVVVGDQLLGPVDPEALDGIWASLRMGTTLRPASRGSNLGLGERGVIVVSFPDETMALELGNDTADGGGLYAKTGAPDAAPMVVESELGWLVDQPGEAWLDRGMLELEPSEVASLAFGDALALSRGEDDLWRVQAGDEPALLQSAAVEQRISRLLGARLDPLQQRAGAGAETFTPWLVVTDAAGGAHPLMLGGACPGRPGRLLVDRGPGLVGCIDESIAEAWSVVDDGMLETRLIPYAYGRVLSVVREPVGGTEQRPLELRRKSGGWVLDDGVLRLEADETEVFRWYDTLSRVELAPLPSEAATSDFVAQHVLTIDTDTTQVLRLACGRAPRRTGPESPPSAGKRGWWCKRDDGPPRLVLSETLAATFDAATFSDKSLAGYGPGEARAIEIVHGPLDGDGLRVSAHLELGVWTLDAPEHPDGDSAIDQVRLEELLGEVGSLRADRWVESAPGQVVRSVRVEVLPEDGEARAVELTLHDDCIVTVDGRIAQVEPATCAALQGGVLFDDPLRYWFRGARSVSLEIDGETTMLVRKDEDWAMASGERVPSDVRTTLEGLESWRSSGIAAGDGDGAAMKLVVRRDGAPSVTVEVGERTVQLENAPWHYREAGQVRLSTPD